MSCTEQIQLILKEFGEAIGLEGLALDETGYCCLTFDDNIFVSIESDEKENRLLMYSFLGAPKGENVAKVYGEILDGNFFWRHTQGATLSRDPNSEGIVLMDRIELRDMNYARFEKALENFVNTTESWMRKLESAQEEEEPEKDGTVQSEDFRYEAAVRV